MILSAVAQGTQFTVEQRFLDLYQLDPYEFVGWEGIWGTLLFLIILPIFQMIPCNSVYCTNGRLENSMFALDQISSNHWLIIFILGSMTSVTFYNGFGLTVTKLVSATNRVIVRQLKIILIWLFFLIYPYEGSESFKPIQFLGFMVLLFGVFLYNEVIVLRFWGLSDNLIIQDTEKEEVIELENSSLMND